jgi:hypothetical protein
MSDVEKWIEQWRAGLAGSEVLGNSTVNELESHLREEVEQLKTTGVSDEEAFFVARHRLGDAAALEAEFAKVNPHRRLANRLYWMVMGVLSYFVIWPVSIHISTTAGYLAYMIGLQGTLLTAFASVAAMTSYALVGFLMLRYLASHWHSRIMAKGMVAPLCVGAVAFCANWLLCWTVNFTMHHVWQQAVPPEVWRQITLSTGSVAWGVMMMFLFAGALAIFARRSKEQAEAR